MGERCGREKERDDDGVRDGRRRKTRCRVIPQSILVELRDKKKKLTFSVRLDLETRQVNNTNLIWCTRSDQKLVI
jgi:hypothetical protein